MVFSCAKKRPDQPLSPDEERVDKSVFDDGQAWYLAETITNVGGDSNMLVAHNANGRIVKFKITEKHLIMYNVDTNIHDTEVSKKEHKGLVDGEILSRFPIEGHFDIVRKKDQHGEDTNIWEEKKDDPGRPWNLRTHMRVEFSQEKIESRSTVSLVGGETYQEYVKQFENGGDILKLDISKGEYIDLVVTKQINSPNRANDIFELRKFLLPVKKNSYKSKPIHEKWTDHLGFFTTKIKHFDKYNIPTEKLLINRWDTSKQNITFYFAKSWGSLLGQKYKPLMIKAVSEWNKVFKQRLGIDNFILLKESDGSQTLGDLRFNMIEWLSNDNSVLGFGPSLSDPRTGEILNANLTINISGFLKEFYLLAKQETAVNKGKTDINNQVLSAQLNQLVTNVPESSTKVAAKYLNDIWDRKLDYKAINFIEQNSKINNLIKGSNITLAKQKSLNGQLANGWQSLALIQGIIGKSENIKWQDYDVDKYLETVLLNTFIHELGHTLGLTHNFKGSMDKNNFYKQRNESGEYQYRQSSIMDYVNDVTGMLDKPGLYDFAAIEKGYSDAKEHDLEQIPSQEKEQAKYFKDQFPYEFCWDIHTTMDPMCNMYDQGTSASEIAQFYLTDYQEGYAYRNNVYTHLKKYFHENYHNNYILYLSSKYFVPMRTFVDFWAKKRLEYMGVEKEKEKGHTFFNAKKSKKIKSQPTIAKEEFINTKEGEDLTKAAKISLEFMFSALYNPFDDLTKINADGTIERTGTLYDRLLALNFLNMKTVTEVIDESSFFNQNVNYFDFSKIIGESDEYLNKYLTVINGVFTRYEPYLGFETRDEAEIYFVNPLIRNMAAGQVIMSEFKGTNINRDFNVVVEEYYRKQISTLKQTEEELAKRYEILKRDFLPVVTPDEISNFTQIISTDHDLLPNKNDMNVSTELKEILNHYGDSKKYLSSSGLPEKLKAQVTEINELITSNEKNESMNDKKSKNLIIEKIGELKKLVMFENNLGFEIEIEDPENYHEQFKDQLLQMALSSEEKSQYLKKSYNSLVGYKNVLTNYQNQKEQLGLHSINRKKLSELNEQIKNLTANMEKNFTPIVDPINLLNSATINHLQRTLRLKPVYLEMYLQNAEAFQRKLEGLSKEQIEQEYMNSVEELSEPTQKIVLTCYEMLKIYEEISNNTRRLDDSLELLISLNEKLFLEQKLLDGTIVGIIKAETFEKLLQESEKKNRFSKAYYQQKRQGLKNLIELEKLEREKNQILAGGDTLRIVDYSKSRIIETPSSGVTANLVYRIGRIDDMIKALEKDSGNESTISDMQEYKEYELNYLGLLRDLYYLKSY